jgi:hypothetical protein
MLDVKEAAQRASEYFATLFPHDLASKARLEEVELTDDGQYWLITLGYPKEDTPGFFFGPATPREYKQFKIEAATGKVVSMKIRNVK